MAESRSVYPLSAWSVPNIMRPILDEKRRCPGHWGFWKQFETTGWALRPTDTADLVKMLRSGMGRFTVGVKLQITLFVMRELVSQMTLWLNTTKEPYMSITSIDSSSLLANSIASTTASTSAAASSPSSGAVSGHQYHRGGGEQFMQDVKQAL